MSINIGDIYYIDDLDVIAQVFKIVRHDILNFRYIINPIVNNYSQLDAPIAFHGNYIINKCIKINHNLSDLEKLILKIE